MTTVCELDLVTEAWLERELSLFVKQELEPSFDDVYGQITDVWEEDFGDPRTPFNHWLQEQIDQRRQELIEWAELLETEVVDVNSEEEWVVKTERENVELKAEVEGLRWQLANHVCKNCGYSENS
jgi:acetolactate synthase small subunit